VAHLRDQLEQLVMVVLQAPLFSLMESVMAPPVFVLFYLSTAQSITASSSPGSRKYYSLIQLV
jgi:hypothetical protein